MGEVFNTVNAAEIVQQHTSLTQTVVARAASNNQQSTY